MQADALRSPRAFGGGRFDRDSNGQVEWEEFRALGAALLEASNAKPGERLAQHVAPRSGGGTFTRRDASDSQRMHLAAGRIQALARQRSLQRMRLSACRAAI